MPDPAVAPSRTVRLVIVGLALVAASALALSVVGGAWWSIGGVEIGPHGSRHCMGGADACGLQWLGGDQDWPRLGTTAWGTALLAALVLLMLGAAVAAKRTPRLLAMIALSATLTTAVAGALFFRGFPGFAGASLDRGFWLFAIGVFFGLAAGAAVTRRALLLARAAAAAAAAVRAPRARAAKAQPQPQP